MKVAFDGKVRGCNPIPSSMDELRKIISRKFTERSLIEEAESSKKIRRN